MSIIRINKSKDYTVMSNHHLNNKELSLKAKGLLSFMLSKPDSWDFSVNGLVAQLKEGRDSVLSAMGELIKLGYVKRTQTNIKGKFAKVDYDVYEKPQHDKPLTEEPQREKPLTDVPLTEKPLQVNTNNKKILTKVITKEEREKEKRDFAFNECSPTKDQENEFELFLDYWTESGENDKKMKFEKEKSFSWSRRWKMWLRNNKKWNAEKKEKSSVKKEKSKFQHNMDILNEV